MLRLFCYGTLQVPQVMRAVTGHEYPGITAVLRDYAIYRVKNAEYPGIIPSEGCATEGILYRDISHTDLKKLDLFEGELYDRQMLKIRLPDHAIENAWAYLISRQHIDVLSKERWRLADFEENGLEKFMQEYVHARKDIYSDCTGNEA